MPRRKCQCAGDCGPQAQNVSRREFLALAGAGAATAAVPAAALEALRDHQATAADLDAWKAALRKPDRPRVYRSGVHRDARMHLGGIGTGNVEVGADGQFTTWQLFNTWRDGHVPMFFALRAGGYAALLQTEGGPELPKVERIEMRGEYPIAKLRYTGRRMPVQVEMEAFSPFAPLDSRLSSIPAAALVFRIHNTRRTRQTVSIAGFLQNPVGYDAAGAVQDRRHVNYGGNVNESFVERAVALLSMRAEPAPEVRLARPVRLQAGPGLGALTQPPDDRPVGLTIEGLEALGTAGAQSASGAAIWLEDAPAEISASTMRAVRARVEAGATLILAGAAMPLIAAHAGVTGGGELDVSRALPDILFEDFESGYDGWTVEGEAFGTEPARGTLPNQNPVTGHAGGGLVNSFLGGDDTVGRMRSREFPVERGFIRFLVGGGSHATTQMRLVVGGRVVRAISGKDNERLEPAVWDVNEFRGQRAHLEIVDEQRGFWGHVNVDHIEFTDMPGNAEALAALDALLPLRCTAVRAVPPTPERRRRTVEFVDARPRPGATRRVTRSGVEAWERAVGSGRVVLLAGQILDPALAGMSGPRRQAYAEVCELLGMPYDLASGVPATAHGFGTLCLATTGPNPTASVAIRDWAEAWREFASRGAFAPVAQRAASAPTPTGETVRGALASTVEVGPGETVEVPFILAWHYPNKLSQANTPMGCHYATLWPDAVAVAREVAGDLRHLRERTVRFRDTFYDSTLPYWMLDCITANLATIRHIGVVFQIANGDVYGWEGSNACCQPTCTHVWGYEQTLARLFPDLARDMRRIDFKHQQRADGGVNNRTAVPSPPWPTGEFPFADGHASCVLKAYREALNTTDERFLREYWPHVRRAVEYLINRDAATSNGEPDGVLEDDQWNTYDQILHGVTSFISGYYLAALRAGEEWAKRVGDQASASRFRSVFERGRARLQELCWDGEYFRQHLANYERMPGTVGPGCMSDQLIGQWWCHQLGLGYLLPPERVKSALAAVVKHNWKTDLTGWRHSPRAFAGDRDKGLIIVTWPKGGRPPHVMLYSDEVWTGIEYQVAAHLLYEGMLDEAYAIVKGARDRYDGMLRPPIPRNPWNEIECGGHYARAMSSWSLLLAATGWEYDGPAAALRIAPHVTPENLRACFCGPEGWGQVRQLRRERSQRNEIRVVEGQLRIGKLTLVAPRTPTRLRMTVDGRVVRARLVADGPQAIVTPAEPLTLTAGQTLAVSLS